MSAAIFRAMLLGFVRDRAALAMSALLPVVFFLVFAAIFGGATGEGLRLRLAIADEVRSETSARLLAGVAADPAVVRVGEALSAEEVADLVRRGTADVGLVVQAGAEPLGELGGVGKAPLRLVIDPARAVAAQMTAGLVQRVYFSALPDVALGGVARLIEEDFLTLDDEQRRQLHDGLAGLRRDADEARAEGRPSAAGLDGMFEREVVAGRSARRNHVAYYAGAVSFLFLLFSAVHGALTLQDERDAGILDRLLAGPGGTGSLVTGKFLFLVVQGFVQVALILVVAWLVHGVELPGHLPGAAATTLASAVAAAGLALALTSACRTRRQAQTFANISILLISAVGGSMVPRFFMPAFMQQLGWLTPNTWALEAYAAVFWRDEPLSALVLPLGMLLAAGLLGYAASRALTARWETV